MMSIPTVLTVLNSFGLMAAYKLNFSCKLQLANAHITIAKNTSDEVSSLVS